MGGVFVLTRQAAVSGDIRVQDGGQLPRQTVYHAAMLFVRTRASEEMLSQVLPGRESYGEG